MISVSEAVNIVLATSLPLPAEFVSLPETLGRILAEDIIAVTEERGLAALVITHDETFAKLVGHRALRLEASTGALKPLKKGWLW